MASTVKLHASNDQYKGTGKPWIARLIGLDKKFGFEREFTSIPCIAYEPDLYQVCNIDKKGNKDTQCVAIVRVGDGIGENLELERINIKDETAVEILKSGRSVSDIAAFRGEDRKAKIRKPDGKLCWWDNAAANLAELRAERETLRTRLADLDKILKD